MWSIHTVDYDSALKKKGTLMRPTARVTLQDTLHQVKQARQKGQILHDSAYLKYLGEANSLREKVLEVTRGCQERKRDLLFSG